MKSKHSLDEERRLIHAMAQELAGRLVWLADEMCRMRQEIATCSDQDTVRVFITAAEGTRQEYDLTIYSFSELMNGKHAEKLQVHTVPAYSPPSSLRGSKSLPQFPSRTQQAEECLWVWENWEEKEYSEQDYSDDPDIDWEEKEYSEQDYSDDPDIDWAREGEEMVEAIQDEQAQIQDRTKAEMSFSCEPTGDEHLKAQCEPQFESPY